jgi:hypothetical protein
MSRLSLLVLPLFATPALAHEGLHHHPHGIEYGWVTAALLGSMIGGGVVYAVLRRRK